MRKVVAGVVLGVAGMVAWNRLHAPVAVTGEGGLPAADAAEPAGPEAAPETRFKCDGRVYCSQMTSCEEAEFFLENCPGVKMDGGGDGVPCERQWCRDR